MIIQWIKYVWTYLKIVNRLQSACATASLGRPLAFDHQVVHIAKISDLNSEGHMKCKFLNNWPSQARATLANINSN